MRIRISELVAKLGDIAEEHGDLEVQAYTTHGDGYECIVDVDGAEFNDDGDEQVVLITGEVA